MGTYQDLALAEEEQKLEVAVAASRNVLLEAPTGSGKSLYLPWFLERHFKGSIVVLQPRRIAALALAQYSAKLHNEPCGKTVGYQFRQESCRSADTRILFQTYGNFLQEVLHGKCNAEWILFDEFHERKADMDLLFAYLLKLQKTSENAPRLMVMSAKLNRDEMESALGVKCLELGHPLYPVQILNQNPAAGTNLEDEVVRALRTLYRNNVWQTTLVFLPGKGEIAKCHTAATEALGQDVADMLELYAGQSREIQDQIFESTDRPRIIFTTNIAETSITVPNVTGVVDSGIERSSEYDDNQKVNVLRTVQISKQNSIQRSGRAGRTQNGVCIRLWNDATEARMPDGIIPEVTLIEPSEFLLQKAALENFINQEISLSTALPKPREEAATSRLINLGMITADISPDPSHQSARSGITELGLKAVQSPLSDVSLSKILLSSNKLSDLTLAAMSWIHSGSEALQKNKVPTDLLNLANDTIKKNISIPKEVEWTFRQLKDYCKRNEIGSTPADNLETAKELLSAYQDRLATPTGTKSEGNSSNPASIVTYKLPNQNAIRLQVAEPPYALLAISMLRTGTGSKIELRTNLYVPIAESLLHNDSESVRYELLWRSGQERFIGIEIRETGAPNGEKQVLSKKEILPQEASPKVLASLKELTVEAWREKLEKENWTGRYFTESLQTLLIKMRLGAKLYPEFGLAEFNDEDMELIFDEFTNGIFLLRDLNEDRYRNILEDYFGKSMLQWLHKTFPDHYILPNGKKARYTYQEVASADENTRGQIVESGCGVLVEVSARIEDLMELRGEHHIADGKLKVRYDILAPNFRTIQKTWDLTGFWKNTYAEVRKELRGRYPKHPWPENVL